MKTVAVHNGKFHADEVFAIAILKKIYPELVVIRTRDHQKLAEVDARVDVGMKYEPENLNFDHHQGDGAGVRENEIPYASVGLIWKHYGEQLTNSTDSWDVVDKSLIQPIDADDCGVSIVEKITKVSPFTVSKLIDRLNPNWKEPKNHDEQFQKAVDIATIILEREIITANNLFAANEIVREAVEQRINPGYIILEQYCPWKKVVKEFDEIMYVVFPGANQWCINAVSEKDFISKKPFPKAWCGLENEELAKVSGVAGAQFCHKTGFFFAAKTKEDAISAANKSLAHKEE